LAYTNDHARMWTAPFSNIYLQYKFIVPWTPHWTPSPPKDKLPLFHDLLDQPVTI